MRYTVINLMNKEYWEGEANSAKEVYGHIKINKGDTTVLHYGRLTSVKEW